MHTRVTVVTPAKILLKWNSDNLLCPGTQRMYILLSKFGQ